MQPYWETTVNMKKYPPLKGDISTDVLIIGGGTAGILCGYKLKRAGVSCVIAEADRICRGVTSGTTAKITAQHGLIYNRLINEFSTEKARMYLEANLNALDSYRELCEGIDCGFETADSFVYTTDEPPKIEKEIIALDKIGFKADFCKETELPFFTAGAVRFPKQAKFNPLKFLSALSDGLEIYENSRVTELKGLTAVTDSGSIKAKKIIVATHFPIINRHGLYFMKMYQKRSYVSAFENAVTVKGMYRDEADSGFSFRSDGGLLIVGSASARTGRKTAGWAQNLKFAEQCCPGAVQKYFWAAEDCITLDGVPYAGNYSSATPDLYVTTGFNKWGMTSAMAAAELVCDMITGRENPYRELFSPSRSMMRKQLFVNGISAVGGLVTPTAKRCPHLGCALKRNKHEHSWDCPCHGSRFSENGKLLDGPATEDKKP